MPLPLGGVILSEEEKRLCEQHFLVHDQAINRNTDDITSIKESLSGLPTKIESIIEKIDKLCQTIEKSDDKFVHKEAYRIEIDSVKSDVKFLQKTVGGIALLIATAFVAHLMGKL